MSTIKNYTVKWMLTFNTILPLLCLGQIKSYRFGQIDSLQKIEKKTIMVFIHTNWCKYCTAMHATTFRNKDVIKKINEDFYFIELNAEEKENIIFNGYTFKYKPTGNNTGIHELAEELMMTGKSISFPTLCFINEKHEIIYQQKDYINQKYLLEILKKL